MNKKELKRRLYPVNFRKQYQARILRTVEREMGLPSTCLCVFIAEIAKRISNGKLGTKQGLLVVSDKGKDHDNPLITPHAWNTHEGRRIDLSPWSVSPYPIEYLAKDDFRYDHYKRQALPFGDGPMDIFEEEMNKLIEAFHSNSAPSNQQSDEDFCERLRDQVRAVCNGQFAFAFC